MASKLLGSLVLASLISAATAAHAQPALDPEHTAEVDDLVRAGRDAIERKRFDEAARRFERSVVLAPARLDAQLGLAEALFWLGQHERALLSFERLTIHAPGLPAPLSGLGHACLGLADRAWARPRTREALLDRATSAFQLALALEPDDASARDGQRHLARARRLTGQSLRPLEWATALLVFLLCASAAIEVRRRGPPRLRDYVWPLALFASTRLVVLVAFAVAPSLVAEAPSHPHPVLRDTTRPVLDSVAGRWDANLYADVALGGYGIRGDETPEHWGTAGQFPLLPVLFRALAYALDDAHWAALLVPNAALLLACCLLFSLLREQHGERLAVGAVTALLVHPASLHGSVLYAESLALLGLVGITWSLQRGALASATLWGVFAGLSRLNTLAIVPWLLFELWQKPEQRSLRSLVARLSPALGVLLFMAYLQLELGDAFAYVRELRENRYAGAVLVGIREIDDLLVHVATFGRTPLPVGSLPLLAFALSCFVLTALAAAALLRERAFGAALFVGSGLVLASMSNLASHPRYLWLLFPVVVWIARVCDRPGLRVLLPLASSCGLFVAAVAFARWYFVP